MSRPTWELVDNITFCIIIDTNTHMLSQHRYIKICLQPREGKGESLLKKKLLVKFLILLKLSPAFITTC